MSRFKTVVPLLMLVLSLPLGMVTAQTGGSIAYGEEVTGTITDEDPIHRWTFDGAAGDAITISMEATDLVEGGLDSYLQLLDPSGEILVENDDASNATVNAEIENFTLPLDGTYTIIASRFGLENGLATGDYRLTLTLESGAAATEEPATADVRPIVFDIPVAGTLNRQNYEDLWSFEGEAGEVVNIRMYRTSQGSDLDTFLRLLDDESRELARNDDAGAELGVSEILNFELPYTGAYTVVATRYGFESGTSSGDYALEITRGGTAAATPAPPTQTPTTDATLVAYGDFVTGSLAGRETDSYRFEGSADDVVTISAKRASGELDPSLVLLNTEASILAENAQFNGAADARIVDFTLPADGSYFITVAADTPEGGDYVLYLFSRETAAASTPSADTPDAVDLSSAALIITLSWEGAADFDLAVIEPDGSLLNYDNLESASGGKFGGDANGGCSVTSTTPSETIYWETAPPNGDYQIEAAFVFPCGEESPVPFMITVTFNGEVVETIEGELNEGEAITYDRALE